MVTTASQFGEMLQPNPHDALAAALLARAETEIKAAAAQGQKRFSVPVEGKYVPVVQRIASTYRDAGWQVTLRHEPNGNDIYLDFATP